MEKKSGMGRAVGTPLTRAHSAHTPPRPPRSPSRSAVHNLYGSFVTFILNGVFPAGPPFAGLVILAEREGGSRERVRERERETPTTPNGTPRLHLPREHNQLSGTTREESGEGGEMADPSRPRRGELPAAPLSPYPTPGPGWC